VKSILFLILCIALNGVAVASSELHSYALVNDDASLSIEGRRVHLYGIYLPGTERGCRRNFSNSRCDPDPALALSSRIRGFLHCYPQTKNPDRSLNAICYIGRGSFSEGEDLAVFLLEEGLALALPESPFKYQAHERIARHQERGVWAHDRSLVIRRRFSE